MARARKSDTPAVRLMVRTVAAMGELRRYRAGLGPFTREPQVIEASPEVVAALEADPVLAVERIEE
jgi:hypothetical protein